MKSMLYKILSSKALSFPRKFFLGILLDYLRSMQREVITLVTVDETWKLVSKIKKEVEMLLPVDQAEKIYLAVIATKKVPGDIAEAGVYQGGSARLICEAKGDKPLHLFDTFEGLPEVAHIDDGFHKGQFKESLENVKRYLVRYENVYFHKGLIPSTFDPIKDISFSFVHLDVDLYESTLNCLNFFYPRMTEGGVIISHDYPSAAGVKKAFDEFFKDKPEPIIQISGSQCLIVKT